MAHDSSKLTGASPIPSIGISGLSVYLPERAVKLKPLAEERNARRSDGDSRDFVKSLRYTGQEEMRIPEVWEDTVTMIAESVRDVVRSTGVNPTHVSQFVCGTETAMDHAKPLSSFAQGLLEQDGIRIGPDTSIYEVKHACAGGTYGLLGAMSQIAIDSLRGLASPAIVTMGDTSRYDLVSTAEFTQGAGAVSLLVETDPKLIRLDLGVVGYNSQSVDDFFRNIGSSVAKARGKFSVQCYKDALVGAYQSFKDKALKSGLIEVPTGKHFLDGFDYVLLHAPFRQMPVEALTDLLAKARGISAEAAEVELARLRLPESLHGTALAGNLYTCSLYLCLANLLESELKRIGDEIEGKRILFASYGSGNTMVVYSGTIVPGAAAAIRKIRLTDTLKHRIWLGTRDYEDRVAFDKFDRERYAARLTSEWASIPANRYYLREIRVDGYREYGVKGKETAPGAVLGAGASAA